MFKEFMSAESHNGNRDISSFHPYSWPVHLYWQSVRVTFLQMFPMKGITILNFDHSHSFMDICYVFSGSGRLLFEDGSFVPLRRGTLCYINTAVVHRVVSDEDYPLELYNASFEFSPYHSADKVPSYIAESEAKIMNCLKENRYMSADDCYHCEDFLRNALSLLNSPKPGEFVKFKNCISNFLMSAFQAMTGLEADPKIPILDNMDEEMTVSAMKMVFYMRDHYTEGISLTDVAKALNYSPRQCQRLIQDFLGVSFAEFILSHQIRYAKTLLVVSDATLEEIAENTGFKSSKALTQQFKAFVGVTPNTYRKNHKHRRTESKGSPFDE